MTNDLDLHVLGANDGTNILEAGIILGNIHQLYQNNTGGKINMDSLLRFSDKISIFNDEAHNTPAPEYDNVLRALSLRAKFRLDTTATPDRADGQAPDSKMIYEFSITDAEATNPPIIKRIYVYQPVVKWVQLTYTNKETGEKRTVDEMDEEFKKIENGLSSTQWVTDREPMFKQMQIALNRLAEQEKRAESALFGNSSYNPILFVVAICKSDAREAKDMLEREFKVPALLVTEDSETEDRLMAGIIGKKGKNLDEAIYRLGRKLNDENEAKRIVEKASKYRAIVSVLMLREGWDVPPVTVILLLRKFSSKVYGQQVIGRGLRLNIRDKDVQEKVDVIDHEKLDHQWLWDLLGAIVRKDVVEGADFTEEDIPPKRKEQELVNRDNLIEIPVQKKGEEDKIDLDDILNITYIAGDFPEWRYIIDNFDYLQNIEITKLEIEDVKGRNLSNKNKFYEQFNIENESTKFSENIKIEKEELIEEFKSIVRDIASLLLAEEGIGSHELGYLYSVLLEHIKKKFLDSTLLSDSSEEKIIYANKSRHKILEHFKDKSGLISSIIKYR
jgi:type III restriction enzyme